MLKQFKSTSVADQVFAKIRNLTYRYMPNQLSLFPKETQQYDTWLLRELINNCIAHSNYQLGGRIYINESEDAINITNPYGVDVNSGCKNDSRKQRALEILK